MSAHRPRVVREQLVERDDELAAIGAALARARSGHGAVVVVEGPAGCGKSALLRAAARSSDWRFSSAIGGEFEGTAAFGVARELLGGFDTEAMTGAAALAAPLFRPTGGTSDAGALRHGLYWMVAWLAEEGPLLLIVDDLQWADDESARFLEYLAARLDGLRVALLMAWRSDESRANTEVLDRLVGVVGATVVRPAPLSEAASFELLRARVGEYASRELARRVHVASGGNAFLLSELVGALGGRSGRDLPDTPERVTRALHARLARLPPAARSLTEALAVLGRGTNLGQVAALAGLERTEAAAALDALVTSNVVTPQRPLDFVHPLVRSAIYDSLLPGRRSAAHERAARILAHHDADPEVIARHLLRSEPAADSWTVEALLRALRAALRRGSPTVAAEYGRRALDEPAAPTRLCDVLEELAVAEGRAYGTAAYRRLDEAAELTAHGARRLRLAVRRAEIGMGSDSASPDDLAKLAAALDAYGETDRMVAAEGVALLLGGTINVLGVDQRGAAARAEAMRVDLPEGVTRRVLAGFLAYHYVLCGGPAHVVLERGCEAIGDEAGHRENLRAGWQLAIAATALAGVGASALATLRLEEALDSARRERGPVAVYNCLQSIVEVQALAGDLSIAETAAIEVVELLEAFESPFTSLYGALVIGAAFMHRAPRRGLDLLARIGADGDLPMVGLTMPALYRRGCLRLQAGDVAGADSDATQAQELARAHGMESAAFAPVAELRTETLLAKGQVDAAHAAAKEALAVAERFSESAPLARAQRVAAMAGTPKQRASELRAAVDALAACGQPIQHARGLLDLGAELRRTGQRVKAREPLASAREIAQQQGALHLAERALVELHAAGARPRRIMRRGVDSLTPSEARIARMAAEGHSNREIAELLFITQKTVEKHLGRVYSKLDIPSREHLSTALSADLPRPGSTRTVLG